MLLEGLYAITPDTPDDRWLEAACQAVLAGGCRFLQYRDKINPPARQQQRAERLNQLCRQAGATLIINDNLELALAVDAGGLHLGADDGDLRLARARLGSGKLLGASCYQSLPLALAARDAGADYAAFGAVFASPTKPHAPSAPLSLFAACQQATGLPACAIGGITRANARPVLQAGARLLAVISDLFPPGADADTIHARTLAFQSLFQESPHDLA